MEIFDAARKLPETERPTFLDAECGRNSGLRQRVEQLLRSDEAADSEFLREATPWANETARKLRSRVKELFVQVLDTPERDRDQYLEEVCSNDPALRLELDKLLQGYTQILGQDDSLDAIQSLVRNVDPSPPPDRIGPYPVVRELGRGGMGIVYQAIDTKLKREIALKVLPRRTAGGAERLVRFEREAELLASLNHPNIATIHSLEEHDGVPFLTLELVNGETLSKQLRRGPLSIEDSLSVAHQVTLALEAAHKRQIVHRDLKPGNIMVTPEGVVKVLDFGLAKALRSDFLAMSDKVATSDGRPEGVDLLDLQAVRDESATVSLGATREGAILGTPGYMSPEQLEGRSGDHRVDVWGLGCVLFECLTGQRAFSGTTPQTLSLATLQEEPEWIRLPPETPERVRTLLSHCLAKGAEDRLHSATEARHVLEEAIAKGPLDLSFTAYRRGRIAEWSAPRYRLDKEFVALTLLVDQGQESAAGRWFPRPERYRDLGEILEAIDDPALVILGQPGSGKSTLLRRFEIDVAEAALSTHGTSDKLTYFIQLNHYRARRRGEPLPDPGEWLAERWQGRFPSLPSLDSLIQTGRMVLLLDALNEMPTGSPADLREAVLVWKEFLDRLATEYPGNRVVFTCRTLDYSAPLSSSTLPVPQVVIEPLGDDQVEQFLTKYLPDQGEAIWNELRGTPQLEVMRSPYFLSLLVDQVLAHGTVPGGRPELFTNFVRRALRRGVEQDNPLFAEGALLTARDLRQITQWKWRTSWELPERGVLVPKLSELAFGMQDRSGDGGESQVRVPLDDALDILHCDDDEKIVEAGLSLSVLDEDPTCDELLFFHQLFQEYFAARQWARDPQPNRLRVSWRKTEIRPSVEELLVALPVSQALPELPTTGWEETALLAASMAPDPEARVRALMEVHLALAGRCAGQPEVRDRLSPGILNEIRWALVARSRDPEADLRARIAAGLALGPLGDPRFELQQGPHGPYLSPPMVDVPEGRYPIGEGEPLGAEARSPAHGPRHEVVLPPFRVGRFPVTNAEWHRFKAAGGYEDDRWWDTEGARRWWSGEGTADTERASYRQNWREWRKHPEQVEELRAAGRFLEGGYKAAKRLLEVTEVELEASLCEWLPGGKLREPASWHDETFNNPSQPVVGVSWYEARAYANWLSAQTGTVFRLPTEAEWEVAARGKEARKYAWGEEPGPLRANTLTARIRRTTPVGVFREGETPEGVTDLTGNISEWTSSLFTSEGRVFRYPYRRDDGREDQNAGPAVGRSLRGGPWSVGIEESSATIRYCAAPDWRMVNLGFRLVSV